MNCPKCGSDSTRKCQVVFEEGTYTETSDKEGYKTGISTLANTCSPPQKKGWIGTILGGFTLAIISFVVVLMTTNDGIISIISFLVVSAGSLMLSAKGFAYNMKDYPRLLATWNRKWICLKCGNIFVENA